MGIALTTTLIVIAMQMTFRYLGARIRIFTAFLIVDALKSSMLRYTNQELAANVIVR